MLDLIDIAKRVGPRFPSRVLLCDPSDRKQRLRVAEWDDDMTYLTVDYDSYKAFSFSASVLLVGGAEVRGRWSTTITCSSGTGRCRS